MAKLALLDETGLLTGYRKCAAKAWLTEAGQVAVPDECKLEPGRYRWTGGEDGTFAPLPPKGSEAALVQDPDAIRAIALGLVQIAEHIDLPEETLRWLETMPLGPVRRPKR